MGKLVSASPTLCICFLTVHSTADAGLAAPAGVRAARSCGSRGRGRGRAGRRGRGRRARGVPGGRAGGARDARGRKAGAGRVAGGPARRARARARGPGARARGQRRLPCAGHRHAAGAMGLRAGAWRRPPSSTLLQPSEPAGKLWILLRVPLLARSGRRVCHIVT